MKRWTDRIYEAIHDGSVIGVNNLHPQSKHIASLTIFFKQIKELELKAENDSR